MENNEFIQEYQHFAKINILKISTCIIKQSTSGLESQCQVFEFFCLLIYIVIYSDLSIIGDIW